MLKNNDIVQKIASLRKEVELYKLENERMKLVIEQDTLFETYAAAMENAERRYMEYQIELNKQREAIMTKVEKEEETENVENNSTEQ